MVGSNKSPMETLSNGAEFQFNENSDGWVLKEKERQLVTAAKKSFPKGSVSSMDLVCGDHVGDKNTVANVELAITSLIGCVDMEHDGCHMEGCPMNNFGEY